MKISRWIPLLFVAVTWVAVAGLSRAADTLPPKPAEYVDDTAGILSAATRSELNTKLAAYERETSNQVLVATFPDVPGDYQMEDFTQRTAEAWGVGQKKSDNGVVLFVFPNSHKMRIEVGYGLEGAIPDATAKSIIENEMKPAFRAGNFDGGVVAGVDAIVAAARGEYKGTGQAQGDGSGSASPLFVFIFLMFVVVFVVFGMLVRASQSYTYDSRGRRRGTTGWMTWLALNAGSSSGGSSSWSSGDSGGGGFSGGGGSFGGGGASGGW